jgi:hypothetical protein
VEFHFLKPKAAASMYSSSLRSLEERLILGSLVVAAATSVVLNFVGIDPKWYVPGMFVALYAILRAVGDLREEAPRTEQMLYHTVSVFYSDAIRRMRAAESHIWVTQVRRVPPESGSTEDASYFRGTIEWAQKHPDREFRRIIGVSNSESIAAWLKQHHEETENVRNYKVRIIPLSGMNDEIGIAIIDQKTVRLALSGDGTSMMEHVLKAPEAIRTFREYYIQKWEQAETIPEYLSARSSMSVP